MTDTESTTRERPFRASGGAISDLPASSRNDTVSAIADLLVRKGVITRSQLAQAKQHKTAVSPALPLIPALKELNFITSEQLEMTLQSNKIVSKIGDLLVELGYLTETDLEHALQLQKTSRGQQKLGEVLVSEKLIKEDDIEDVLGFQKTDTDLRNVRFFPFRRAYLTLGTAITILGSVVGAVYMYFQIINDHEHAIAEYKREIAEKNKQLSSQKHEIKKQQSIISSLSKQVAPFSPKGLPVPIAVNAAGSVIAPAFGAGEDRARIELQWLLPEQTLEGKYEIIVRNVDSAHAVILPIDNIRDKRMSVKLDHAYDKNTRYGDFAWHIRSRNDGRISRPVTFRIYPSTLDRVRHTGKLMVATTKADESSAPTLIDSAPEGRLLAELTRQLKATLKLKKMNFEIKEYAWRDLLNEVHLGNVDIAIAGITPTPEREKHYHPLRFSKPYQYNHQILVQSSGKAPGDFPDALRDATVAVQNNSTNLLAAQNVLARRYGFHIKVMETFQKSYTALQSGAADFALIDSAYYLVHKNEFEIMPYGPNLDADLKDFYRGLLGTEHEYFAIAVHDTAGASQKSATLLSHINAILAAPRFLESLGLAD